MTRAQQEAGKPASPSQTEAQPAAEAPKVAEKPKMPKEIDGPKGPEPTRYGDWERKGRVSDF
ncbi:DUF1674 domain-containing protein [Teichococcus coralli]|nr:succinate dehydrogenase assembly factor 4 [Pseudoroseomonas coralli]